MSREFQTVPQEALLAAQHILPLRDKVCVYRLPYEHDVLAVVGITLNRGVVVAVGPGRRVRRLVRYDKAPGALTGAVYLPDGKERVKDGKPLVQPVSVAVGDVVEFSPNRQSLEFTFEGFRFVMIDAQSIYGKDTSGSRGQAILSQRSAGWERGINGARDTFLAR